MASSALVGSRSARAAPARAQVEECSVHIRLPQHTQLLASPQLFDDNYRKRPQAEQGRTLQFSHRSYLIIFGCRSLYFKTFLDTIFYYYLSDQVLVEENINLIHGLNISAMYYHMDAPPKTIHRLIRLIETAIRPIVYCDMEDLLWPSAWIIKVILLLPYCPTA